MGCEIRTNTVDIRSVVVTRITIVADIREIRRRNDIQRLPTNYYFFIFVNTSNFSTIKSVSNSALLNANNNVSKLLSLCAEEYNISCISANIMYLASSGVIPAFLSALITLIIFFLALIIIRFVTLVVFTP